MVCETSTTPVHDRPTLVSPIHELLTVNTLDALTLFFGSTGKRRIEVAGEKGLARCNYFTIRREVPLGLVCYSHTCVQGLSLYSLH